MMNRSPRCSPPRRSCLRTNGRFDPGWAGSPTDHGLYAVLAGSATVVMIRRIGRPAQVATLWSGGTATSSPAVRRPAEVNQTVLLSRAESARGDGGRPGQAEGPGTDRPSTLVGPGSADQHR